MSNQQWHHLTGTRKILKRLKVLSNRKKKKMSIKIQLGFNMKNLNVPKEFQLSNHVYTDISLKLKTSYWIE